MLTIVINNREGMEITRMPSTMKDHRGVPLLGDTVTFIPGVNLIDSETLKTLRENKLFDAKFSTKIPRSAGPDANPEKVGEKVLVVAWQANDKAPGLKDIPDKKACELISETFSTKTLDHWLSEEARPDVRVAIMNQQTALRTGQHPDHKAT